MSTIILFIIVIFILRLITLFYSIKNEKRIKSEGAIEYGKTNSMIMTLLHVLYYISSSIEAYLNKITFDNISFIGVLLFVFSYIILLSVIYQLREVWTVKLYIVKDHKLNTSFLFKYIRHPNYFLNIIPELIGVGMLCKAWHTMIIILPFYAITMVLRIREEERIMKSALK